MEQWIEKECQNTDFGDKRLENRYIKILEDFSKSPMESIPASSGGWSETIAAYRFMNNPKISYNKIFQGHKHSTLERISHNEHPYILAIQDTTSIDLTDHRSSNNLGHIENSKHRGLFIHPTIAVTPSRVNLGMIDVSIWTRDLSTIGKKKDRKDKDIEDKESYRWLMSYQSANKVAEQFPDKIIVSVGDREYDIFEAFSSASLPNSKAKILIRAAQNRRLALENEETNLLWSALESADELGERELIITQTKQHKARTSKLSIKVKEVILKAPYRKNKKLEDIKLTAVLAVEKNPPSDEDKIEWLLLSSLEVNNLEEALSIIDFYSCRWQIEMYFRILKGGCEIEKLQLEAVTAIENAIAVYMVVSWRIQYLLMLGRQCPNLPSDLLFSEDEWQSVYVAKKQEIPEQAPALNEIIILISTLGGYLNRNSDSPPGVKVFWKGLVKLADYSYMYGLMKK